MDQTSKRLKTLTARVVEICSLGSYKKVVVEVAAGCEDGTAAAGLDVVGSFGTTTITGKTDGFGVARLSFSGLLGADLQSNIYKWSAPPRIQVRAKGFAMVAEAILPVTSIVADKTLQF